MTLDWSLMRGPGACSLFGCWAMCKLHSYSGTLRADYSWLLDWNVLGLRGSSWSVGTSWLCRLWFCCWFLGKNKSIQTYYNQLIHLLWQLCLFHIKLKEPLRKCLLHCTVCIKYAFWHTLTRQWIIFSVLVNTWLITNLYQHFFSIHWSVLQNK